MHHFGIQQQAQNGEHRQTRAGQGHGGRTQPFGSMMQEHAREHQTDHDHHQSPEACHRRQERPDEQCRRGDEQQSRDGKRDVHVPQPASLLFPGIRRKRRHHRTGAGRRGLGVGHRRPTPPVPLAHRRRSLRPGPGSSGHRLRHFRRRGCHRRRRGTSLHGRFCLPGRALNGAGFGLRSLPQDALAATGGTADGITEHIDHDQQYEHHHVHGPPFTQRIPPTAAMGITYRAPPPAVSTGLHTTTSPPSGSLRTTGTSCVVGSRGADGHGQSITW